MNIKSVGGGLLLALVLLAGSRLPAAEAENPLATLKPQHPRLLADASTWPQLRIQAHTDPLLAATLAQITNSARALLDQTPVTYHKTGRRLLSVCREARDRVALLAFAYRLTGEPVFARRADQEMLAAAAFTDWNPSHFLDVGEMTAALALGYDWLYAVLPEASRQIIRTAIVEKGLRPGISIHGNSWKTRAMNWNQVCFGGLTLGALAIGDEAPAEAAELLRQARAQNPIGLRAYAPDGVYPEGPGYWSYGTTYQVLMIAALESALGTDWGLTASPGFTASAAARVQQSGATGLSFNFSDGHESNSLEPALFWFARRLNQPGLLRFQTDSLRARFGRGKATSRSVSAGTLPFVALWWFDPAQALAQTPPLAWLGHGENPVVVFRSSWTDPNALYLAAKGGTASANHGHMDAGSFVFEADGIRWAVDLGSQDYNSLESKGVKLWDAGQNGERWKVFRLNNRSHNTLTINGDLHNVTGRAEVTKFTPDAPTPGAELDLSKVFSGQANSVIRRFEFNAAQRQAIITDTLRGLKPGADVRWAMVTRASVRVEGDRAMLRQAGRKLEVRLAGPGRAKFEVLSADPPKDDFNAQNPDARILVAHVPAPASGNLTLTVTLTAP